MWLCCNATKQLWRHVTQRVFCVFCRASHSCRRVRSCWALSRCSVDQELKNVSRMATRQFLHVQLGRRHAISAAINSRPSEVGCNSHSQSNPIPNLRGSQGTGQSGAQTPPFVGKKLNEKHKHPALKQGSQRRKGLRVLVRLILPVIDGALSPMGRGGLLREGGKMKKA